MVAWFYGHAVQWHHCTSRIAVQRREQGLPIWHSWNSGISGARVGRNRMCICRVASAEVWVGWRYVAFRFVARRRPTKMESASCERCAWAISLPETRGLQTNGTGDQLLCAVSSSRDCVSRINWQPATPTGAILCRVLSRIAVELKSR